jgi:hypothetical protein
MLYFGWELTIPTPLVVDPVFISLILSCSLSSHARRALIGQNRIVNVQLTEILRKALLDLHETI